MLTKSKRTAPSTKLPEMFAWERLKIAVLENGLLPSIRNEQVLEDPAYTFASARDRARKHASNNLHGFNFTNLSLVVSTPASPLKNQLETRLDDVQATIASLAEVPKHHKRGRFNTERRAIHGRQDFSVPRRDKSSSKDKLTSATRPNTVCDPLRKRRRIVYSRNVWLKSGLTSDETQSDVPPIALGL